MKEIEVKILNIKEKQIIKKLKKLGAKKVFEGKIIASYFDFEDKSLSKENKIIRLRTKGKLAELTFKKSISKKEAKIAEEYNVITDDYKDMKKILNLLGLKEKIKQTKYRTSFTLDDVHFELDKFDSIPIFLEVEAPNIEKLKEYIKKLGFSMKDTKPWTGKNVLDYYKSKLIK